MNQIVSTQSFLFITCIEIGIIMGALFDLIRITRKIVRHPDFFVQLEDLIYWTVCGLIGFYMLYINNYAAIRPFVFAGIFLGAVFYFITFSILFMKVATLIIDYVKACIRQLIKLLLIPIRWLIKVFGIPLKYFRRQLRTVHNYKKRKLRKLKRRWNYTKAELRTELRIIKNKK